MLSRRAAPGWLVAYLVTASLNVLSVFTDMEVLASVTKPLLMPLLLGLFVSSLDGLKHPLATWVQRALVFSWLGDVLLMVKGDGFFMAGLLAFLAAQVCYIVGFRPSATLGPLRSKPWLVIPYVVYGVVVLRALAPDLGGLLIPVAIYTATLLCMAIMATGVARVAAVGAILFVVSDTLLAATKLSDLLPLAAKDWVMPTYLVGQLLIVAGVLEHLGRRSSLRSTVADPA